MAGIFCWNKVSGSRPDSLAWAEPRSVERDIKLLAPVMNVPVKLLYLSLITTFPLFIPVWEPQTLRYLKHGLRLDLLLPSVICLSRLLNQDRQLILLVASGIMPVNKYWFSKDLFTFQVFDVWQSIIFQACNFRSQKQIYLRQNSSLYLKEN